MIGSLTNDCVGDILGRTVFERCIAIVYNLWGNMPPAVSTYCSAVQILYQRNLTACNCVIARTNA